MQFLTNSCRILLHTAVFLTIFTTSSEVLASDSKEAVVEQIFIPASVRHLSGLKFMPLDGQTTQPIGHYEFCKVLPEECALIDLNPEPIKLTASLWNTLVKINTSVNKEVQPQTDMEIYGKDEVWAYPQGVGDCEDYVLEKRRRLRALDIPASNLLITVVRRFNGEGHAVLTVRTNVGDFILDNLTDKINRWDEVKYRFLKRVDTNHSGRWITIVDERYLSVASVE